MTLVPILFQHGQNEGIDEKVLPAGWFASAVNSRFRKDGRLGKRGAFAGRSTSTVLGTSLTGECQLITSLNSQDLTAFRGQFWTWDGGRWTAPLEGSEPLTVLSDFEPVKKTLPAADEARNSTYTTVAYGGGFRFFAWQSSTGVFVRCEKASDDSLVFQERLDGGGTATEPRLLYSSNEAIVYCFWRDGTDIKEKHVSTVGNPTGFSGASTIATGLTAAGGYDVADRPSGTGGAYALVYQRSSDSHIVVDCRTSGGSSATVNFADAASTLTPTVVYDTNDADTRLFVAWRVLTTAAAGYIRCRVYKTDLTGGTATLDVNTLATNDSRPVLVDNGHVAGDGAGAGRAHVCWSGKVAGQDRLYVQQVIFTPGGPSVTNTGILTTLPEMRVASKPIWLQTSVQGNPDTLYLWAFSGRALQKGFFLVEPLWVNGRVHMRQAVGKGYYQDHPGLIVRTGAELLWSYPEVIRGLASGTPAVGSAFYRFTPLYLRPNRATAALGGSLYVAGGQVTQYDGRLTVESGFVKAPEITSITQAGGGALTAAGVYQYIVVYEWIDTLGNRHQSEPSLPVSVTLTPGNQTATVNFTGLDSMTLRYTSSDTIASCVAHVYRTAASGRIYNRVTPDVGAPQVVKVGSLVSYTDAASDASVAGNEVLYTQGGKFGHAPAPACGHLWAGRTRLCASRLADRSIVQFSKLVVPQEPVEWADDDSFRVSVSGDVECAAELDGQWYIFTSSAIWTVAGDGPDDKGQGAFTAPAQYVSSTGCTDWKSLILTSEGLMFQGAQGVYLLPRGGGPPVWIGRAARDELSSATALVGSAYSAADNTAFFTSGTTGFAYDVERGEWFEDTLVSTLTAVGLWDGQIAFGGTDSLYVNDPNYGEAFSQVLKTGQLAPFTLDGFGRVRSLSLTGEYITDAKLTVDVYYDGETTPSTTSWEITNAVGGYVSGDKFELFWQLPRQKCTSVKLRLTDGAPTAGVATSGLIFNGCTLDVQPIRGPARRPAFARR